MIVRRRTASTPTARIPPSGAGAPRGVQLRRRWVEKVSSHVQEASAVDLTGRSDEVSGLYRRWGSACTAFTTPTSSGMSSDTASRPRPSTLTPGRHAHTQHRVAPHLRGAHVDRQLQQTIRAASAPPTRPPRARFACEDKRPSFSARQTHPRLVPALFAPTAAAQGGAERPARTCFDRAPGMSTRRGAVLVRSPACSTRRPRREVLLDRGGEAAGDHAMALRAGRESAFERIGHEQRLDQCSRHAARRG